MKKINELRERFISYGKFEIMFSSEHNVFSCTYNLGDLEPTQFLKSSYEDVLDELEIVINMFLNKYVPKYVQ